MGDIIDGGAGDDTLNGGFGDDMYKYNYTGSDTISDSGGSDTLFLTTRDANGNRYFGDAYVENGALILESYQDDNNKLTITDAFGGNSMIENVTFHADDGSFADVTLRIASVTYVLAGSDIAYFGTKFADTLFLSKGYNEVFTSDGDDQITAGDGGGYIFSEAGDDILSGGDGADYLKGGTGNDNISGGGWR